MTKRHEITATEYLRRARNQGTPDWYAYYYARFSNAIVLTADAVAQPLPGAVLTRTTWGCLQSEWAAGAETHGVSDLFTSDIIKTCFGVTYSFSGYVPLPYIEAKARELSCCEASGADVVWKSVRKDIQRAPRTLWAEASGTQKIKGLRAASLIRNIIGGSCVSDRAARQWRFAKAADYLESGKLPDHTNFPLFVRPCPTRPRHGFVDSQPVHDHAELAAVAGEAVAAEPDAELLLTDFIEGGRSAILTPNSISIGAGHDGATGGKSFTIYGPALDEGLTDAIRRDADIGPDEVPYVELVENKAANDYAIVQARSGPPVSVARDYVPKAVTVERVLLAHPDLDLVKWESTIAKAEPGTVVYAPGLSLASHFCVHAVVNGVPVVTTAEPSVGDVLQPNDDCAWSRQDWKRLAEFIKQADKDLSHDVGAGFSNLAVVGLHFAGQPTPAEDHQLRLLAYGAVSAAKLISAACIGEARHVSNVRDDGYYSPKHDKPQLRAHRALSIVRAADSAVRCARNNLYHKAIRFPLSDIARALKATSYIYNYLAWSSAYGGKKWAGINAGARKLCLALVKFRREPGAKTWAGVVSAWNLAINREHNGGAPALSKFSVGSDYMTRAQVWPCASFLTCGERVLGVVLDGLSQWRDYADRYQAPTLEESVSETALPYSYGLNLQRSVVNLKVRKRARGANGEVDALLALAQVLDVNPVDAKAAACNEPVSGVYCDGEVSDDIRFRLAL